MHGETGRLTQDEWGRGILVAEGVWSCVELRAHRRQRDIYRERMKWMTGWMDGWTERERERKKERERERESRDKQRRRVRARE